MAVSAVQVGVRPEDYLAAERQGEEKHEFFNGEVIRMGGATFNHNRITRNLVFLLCQAVLDQGYEVFSSDLRVHNPDTNSYVYPDVVVVKGRLEYQDDSFDTLFNPYLIAEVLSDSSTGVDRGKKFGAYRKTAGFREYLLIAQDQPLVECYYRQEDGGPWTIEDFADLNASLPLRSLDVELAMSDIYRKVAF